VPFYSPLRYPGGKRRLTSAVTQLLDANHLTNVTYVEPFAGGAAIGLALLLEEYASTIHINDLSRPVYAFWHTVLHDSKDLCVRIERAKLTVSEWKKQRKVYEDRDSAQLDDLGFAALYLNRTNRSGIIDGGVIGGLEQTAKWGIDARFNPDDLVVRIRRIARYASRIHLYQSEALHFIATTVPELGRNVFVFCDPPYIENGEGLYLNEYNLNDHRTLASKVTELKSPWLVTYDAAAVPARLYPRQRQIVYDLGYSAHTRYAGREVMFLSDKMKLPEGWRQSSPVALSHPKSRNPLFGQLVNPRRSTTRRPRPHTGDASAGHVAFTNGRR
jgi:DNA adenine methylase